MTRLEEESEVIGAGESDSGLEVIAEEEDFEAMPYFVIGWEEHGKGRI